MGEQKHTSEPWNYDRVDGSLRDAAGFSIARFHGGRRDDGNKAFPSVHDARRIVACVNACAGIPTEELEATALRDAGLVLEQGWQDIETAPKDETHFLAVAVSPERTTTATEICWNPWVQQWCRNAGPKDPQPVVIQPTHWRPRLALPAPPTERKGGE